ncbi:MAG: hypothetical protein ACK4S2_10590 [Gemmobacter sp.]|uniref:hypothetical protein n=1 Tax=Gemmobacter sp. TaxID=1898957 RepID=UPI0039198DDF
MSTLIVVLGAATGSLLGATAYGLGAGLVQSGALWLGCGAAGFCAASFPRR